MVWKSLLLCSAASRGEATIYENAESATLLQVGAPRSVHRTTRAHVAHTGLQAVQKQAKAMLYEDTPSEVRKFMNETLKQIEDEVKPLIREQHATDQSVLDGFVVAFQEIETFFNNQTGTLHGLRTTQSAKSTQHKACREIQLEKYFDMRECKDEQDRLEGVFEGKKETYRLNSKGYCNEVVPDNKEHFHATNISGVEYFESYAAFTDHRDVQCVPRNQTYEDKAHDCDILKSQLEAASCESHILHVTSWNTLVEQWENTKASFVTEKDAAQKNAESRLNEMHTLIEVACLLKKVDERGGQACTEADEAQVNAELEECQNVQRDLDNVTPELTLSIPAVPNPPERPATLPWACNSDFVDQEYSNAVLATSAIDASIHESATQWAADSLAMMVACDPCAVDESLNNFAES